MVNINKFCEDYTRIRELIKSDIDNSEAEDRTSRFLADYIMVSTLIIAFLVDEGYINISEIMPKHDMIDAVANANYFNEVLLPSISKNIHGENKGLTETFGDLHLWDKKETLDIIESEGININWIVLRQLIGEIATNKISAAIKDSIINRTQDVIGMICSSSVVENAKITDVFTGKRTKDIDSLSNLDNYYTHLDFIDRQISTITKLIKKDNTQSMKIIDPFGGSASYTINLCLHLAKEISNEDNLAENFLNLMSNSLSIDNDECTVLYGRLRAICTAISISDSKSIRIDFSNSIIKGNSFRVIGKDNKYDVVFTNVPFSTYVESTQLAYDICKPSGVISIATSTSIITNTKEDAIRLRVSLTHGISRCTIIDCTGTKITNGQDPLIIQGIKSINKDKLCKYIKLSEVQGLNSEEDGIVNQETIEMVVEKEIINDVDTENYENDTDKISGNTIQTVESHQEIMEEQVDTDELGIEVVDENAEAEEDKSKYMIMIPKNITVKLLDSQLDYLVSAIKYKNTLTEIIEEYSITSEEQNGQDVTESEPYTVAEFNKEVFGMTFEEMKRSIDRKLNILITGVPGTSKSYNALRFAQALCGYKNTNRIIRIQVSETFSYKEFMCGYQQLDKGKWGYADGIFVQACKLAECVEGKPVVLLIDELSRGNTESIFGEALTLIEKSHRNEEVMLQSGIKLKVPENLYIIATMNTQDISTKTIDIATKQRFAIIKANPLWDNERFRNYILEKSQLGIMDKLINLMVEINNKIKNDGMLGEEYQIGHRQIMSAEEYSEEIIGDIIVEEIVPIIGDILADDKPSKDKLVARLMGLIA